MTTPSGELYALPPLYDLDDHVAIVERQLAAATYASELLYAGSQLSQTEAAAGRVMLVVLRPWISGQPFRLSYLAEAFGGLASLPGPWLATCGEIVEAFAAQQG